MKEQWIGLKRIICDILMFYKCPMYFFIIVLILIMSPVLSTSAQNYISAVEYRQTPPIEKVKKKSKRTKYSASKGKKKLQNKHQNNFKLFQKLNKPGFIVMIVFGALLILLCIYLILNFALFGRFLGAGKFLVYIGFSLIGLLGISLFVPGVIFTKIYNSKNYIAKQARPENKYLKLAMKIAEARSIINSYGKRTDKRAKNVKAKQQVIISRCREEMKLIKENSPELIHAELKIKIAQAQKIIKAYDKRKDGRAKRVKAEQEALIKSYKEEIDLLK
ncbi:MAG: hypothetical protein AB8E82_16305 [Aureispira sp.]